MALSQPMTRQQAEDIVRIGKTPAWAQGPGFNVVCQHDGTLIDGRKPHDKRVHERWHEAVAALLLDRE